MDGGIIHRYFRRSNQCRKNNLLLFFINHGRNHDSSLAAVVAGAEPDTAAKNKAKDSYHSKSACIPSEMPLPCSTAAWKCLPVP